MEFALNELGIEAPLMDMIYQDAAAHLLSSDETIFYLTDKARVGRPATPANVEFEEYD